MKELVVLMVLNELDPMDPTSDVEEHGLAVHLHEIRNDFYHDVGV